MAKNVERLQAREAKELIRREKQLGARSSKFYLIYLFMILALIYITDEMASTISIQFQANIVTEFFVKNMGMEYGAGLSLFSAIGFISYPVTLLIIFYRPLADKFGRKPFLVINTLCMGLGLFLVYLSRDIYVYMIGSTLMSFMVSHDMQCVYILECSDEKSRARNYAIVKAVAILGTLLVPLLRATLMQNVSERWHVVYLVPAIIGFVMALFALLFAKETNAFLTKRIEYLKTPIEEREQRSKEEREQNAQGGILTAVKFAFKHRQLRFLIIACCCFYLASLGTATYSTVMARSALMTEEEIHGDYELETGKVIVEEFKTRNIDPDRVPGVLVHSHGPFTWGTDGFNAVHNAVVLEECAKMNAIASLLSNNEIDSMQQVLLDKHFNRKHGPGAYYGQAK